MVSLKSVLYKPIDSLRDIAWFEWALFFIILFLYSITLIGDHGVRLAVVHTDNGLVAHSLIARFPERFAQDEMSYYSPYMVRGTICFWLPVWLNLHLGFSAPFMDLVLHHLQNILMGFSIFVWSLFLTRNKMLSYVSSLTAMTVWPWGWCLASYPAIMYMTFYTTIAYAIVPLIFYAIAKNKSIKVWLSLLILLGLVHPAVGLYVIGALGVFFIWESLKRSVFNFAALALSFLVCILPSLFNLASIPDVISHADQWMAATKHMHFFPWSQYPIVWDAVVPSFIAFFIYALWAYVQSLTKFSKSTQKLLMSLVISTLVFALIHFIGIGLESITILQLTGLRASALFLLIFWPAVITSIWHRIEFRRPSSCLAIFSFLIFLFAGYFGFGPGFFWGGILIWLGLEWIQFSFPKLPWLGSFSLLISVAVIGFETRYFVMHNELIFQWNVTLTRSFVYWATALTLVLAVAAIRPRIFQWTQIVLVCLAVSFAFYRAINFGAETQIQSLQDLYSAQVWARDHTSTASRFITNEEWRTVSERSKINAVALVNTKIYAPIRKLKELDDYFIKLHGLEDRFPQLSAFEFSVLQDQSFAKFTTSQVRQIQAKWGGDYVVRRLDMPSLDLPEVYRNQTFVIYQLN